MVIVCEPTDERFLYRSVSDEPSAPAVTVPFVIFELDTVPLVIFEATAVPLVILLPEPPGQSQP